ncbi:hypothetical protein RJ641_011469 [Dillenia turbinata]|uniref:Uncharacterized protein n=1 Tax=Dillenia turbinata TaxID=194707 RepID=A0AAN8UWG6_9MAGN
MVLPGSNIVLGPYAGHSQIKEVEFVKSSDKPKNCPKNHLPDFAILGRSNVGKKDSADKPFSGAEQVYHKQLAPPGFGIRRWRDEIERREGEYKLHN